MPSQDEVSAFLKNLPNLKHRVILTTAYAAGFRISEVVSLRVSDIDSQRIVIRIAQGRGSRIAVACSRPSCSNCCAPT